MIPYIPSVHTAHVCDVKVYLWHTAVVEGWLMILVEWSAYYAQFCTYYAFEQCSKM